MIYCVYTQSAWLTMSFLYPICRRDAGYHFGPCQHAYHYECLMNWVIAEDHDDCPTCRRELWDAETYNSVIIDLRDHEEEASQESHSMAEQSRQLDDRPPLTDQNIGHLSVQQQTNSNEEPGEEAPLMHNCFHLILILIFSPLIMVRFLLFVVACTVGSIVGGALIVICPSLFNVENVEHHAL